MGTMERWKLRFFTIWGGQALSLMGGSLAGFALVWYMTKSTGSATVLAVGTIAQLLPGVLLGPFAGALVDRWDRRRVMLAADIVSGLSLGVLALLFWSHAVQVWHIYAIMLVRSVAGSFHFPALQASTSLMVPEDQLTRVGGLNQMLQGLSSIAAPPLGALLLTLLPIEWILGANVGVAAVAVLTMASVSVPRPPRSEEATTVLADVGEGLRYIWGWPGLRMVLVAAALLNLVLTPAFSLMPILVTNHFHGGALELAWTETAAGVGMIAGGVLLGVWGGFKRRAVTMLAALGGLGVGTLAIGAAPASLYPLALAGMFLVGSMGAMANGPMFAILQSVVPAQMQGRVFTVMGSVSMAMAPVGLVLAGPLADRLGVQSWYLIGAVTAVALLVTLGGSSAMRSLEDHGAAPAPEAGEVEAPGAASVPS